MLYRFETTLYLVIPVTLLDATFITVPLWGYAPLLVTRAKYDLRRAVSAPLRLRQLQQRTRRKTFVSTAFHLHGSIGYQSTATQLESTLTAIDVAACVSVCQLSGPAGCARPLRTSRHR